MKYNLAIIGAGPGGYNAAEMAASKGLKVILFERETIGGVCLNEGCIPTKTLLYSAKILDQMKEASKYGLKSENVSFDLDKIIKRKNKIVRKLVAGINTKLNNANITLIRGEAKFDTEDENGIRIICNEEIYLTQKVLLCTGSTASIPPIKGLDNIEYWTSKEALNVLDLPQSLAIIGGGVIGIEFASFFSSMGTNVSVIEALPEIIDTIDYELAAMLRDEYQKKGIKFYLQSRVREFNKHEIIIEKNNEQITITAEKVLVCVGRKPNIKNLNLEKVGVKTERNTVIVNQFMQTSNNNIFGIGDINGKSMLAHTAIREGEVAINKIFGIIDSIDYKTIPGVIYTNPEIAGVGYTEQELKQLNKAYKSHKVSMNYSGRFVVENELKNGLCKILTDDEGRIIGCHILGNPASEFITIASMAIQNKNTLEELRRYVIPHPTVAEILHEISKE